MVGAGLGIGGAGQPVQPVVCREMYGYGRERACTVCVYVRRTLDVILSGWNRMATSTEGGGKGRVGLGARIRV